MFVCGPGHGAAAVLAHAYLDGHYSERYPECSQDEAGMTHLFRHFSAPHGIGSHCTPQLPGSIHEGGELGYSLSHAFGAAFDNPDLIVAAMVGDGEAETARWPPPAIGQVPEPGARRRRAAHPAPERLQDRQPCPAGARIPPAELQAFFEGHGYRPVSWLATIRPPCTGRWHARWASVWRKSGRSRPARARAAADRRGFAGP